ncbi:MAG: class I SAM-dependent methyltransferase [Candidatus Aminicenantes bacterium]|nr:class I SAM-dependent methyltransferase [Candidatus Aminicenantes bacterium]
MQRTIEKLGRDRRTAEGELRRSIDEIKKLSESLRPLLGRLAEPDPPASRKLFSSSARNEAEDLRSGLIELAGVVSSLAEALVRQAETQDALSDARDKLWDAEHNNHVGIIFKSMEWRIDRHSQTCEDAAAVLKAFAGLRDQLGRLQASLEEKRLPTPPLVDRFVETLEEEHYLRFENRFRGSAEDIRGQQKAFLDDFPEGGRILDLGCGRGEFLELLAGKGFLAEGVDSNGGMISSCRDKGLTAEQGDLVERLAARPDSSLDGIFSSQVIEHLTPPGLRRLVELAYAKLRPGGRLLLETVNPLSVFALVHIYFLDFTHRFPVHPLALQFLLETAGFGSVAVRWGREATEEKLAAVPAVDEAAAILNRDIDKLNALLFAPPNYSILGRKA